MKTRHLFWTLLVLGVATNSALAVVVTPTSVTGSLVGDAGSSVDYLLVDNPGFAEAGLQRPLGTAVTLPSGATLSEAVNTFGALGGGAHAESWTLATTAGNPVFSFDLGAETNLGSILLWQYGNNGGGADFNGNHTRDFELIFHTAAEGAAFDFASAGGTEAVEFMGTMQRAGIGVIGSTDLNPAQFFGFGATQTARYVGLRIATNYLDQPGVLAGGDRYGLGEVRFATELDLEGVLDPAMKIVVARTDGSITLENNTGSAVQIAGLGITSTTGSLVPGNWTSITDNYDGPGGAVSNDEWLIFSSKVNDLSEGTLGTGTIAHEQTVELGTGLWARYFDETTDLALRYLDANTGEVFDGVVQFVGGDNNLDDAFEVGDLNFDGNIDELDWPIYRDGYRQNLAGLSVSQGYAMGDLNGDGLNNVIDFGIFKNLYETNNPGASFAALLAGSQVPEPSTWALLLLGMALVGARRIGRKAALAIVALSAFAGFAATSQAALPTLVSNWTLDADATDSVGGHNGTATAVTFGTAGANANTGTSATFDGATSTIDVPFSTDLNPNSFTVSMWALANTASAPHQSAITSRDDFMLGVSTHGYIIYNAPGGSWEFWTGDGDPGWAVQPGTPVATAAWTHLAISYDGNAGVKSFYIDGANVGSVTDQGYSPNGTVEMENLHIGSGSDLGTEFFFDGNIDDVGVFNGVLTQNEIQNVADNGIAAFDIRRMELQVNTTNGIAKLLNSAGASLDLDQYEILSSNGSLNFGNWDSIQDNGQLGLPQGNGSGNGWEVLGTPTANFVGESYLQASSSIGTSDIIDLGNLFQTGGSQDLEFFYRTSDGSVIEGIVDYVTSANVDGDYNKDGRVNAADYSLWRDTLGSMTNLVADGNGNGTVDSPDYAYWRQRFGNISGSGSVAAVVPEPSSALLVLFAGLGTVSIAFRRRTRFAFHFQTVRNFAILAVAWAVVGSAALATVSNDRVYLFGEGAGENGVAGAIVGSGHSIPGAGDTLDELGPSGAFLDLFQSGTVKYENVSPSGLNRPGAASSGLGIRFDGIGDQLNGTPLNRPDELATIIGTYPINYNTITRRGLQLWVYPTASAIGSSGSPTSFQSIVFDSIFSGGPAINAQGQWTQINSFHADGVSGIATVPASVDVPAGDTWYHVMHHNYSLGEPKSPRLVAGTGTALPFTSVMYVDGVAVSTTNDNIDTGGDPAFVGKLVVGAAEVNGDGQTASYGNYFNGVVDDLEMYVYGDNTSVGGMNYGAFDLFADNDWIRQTIIDDPVLQGTLTSGDINRDGSVNGDGTGSPASDDVAAFIAGWGSTNVFQGAHSQFTVGDWNTWSNGDLNHDGITDFADWYILRNTHPSGANLDLAALLGGGQVPEPSSIVIIATLAGVMLLFKIRCQLIFGP